MLRFLFENAESVSVVHRLCGSFVCFQLAENRPPIRSLEFGEAYIIEKTLLGYEVTVSFDVVKQAIELKPNLCPFKFRKLFETHINIRKRRILRQFMSKGKNLYRYV